MFDNDDPLQRQSLIEALASVGLDALNFNSGGGTMHVIVPLLDEYADPPLISAESPETHIRLETLIKTWPHEASLYIATNSLETTCDIGIFGNDGKTGAQIASKEWQHADTLEEAVSMIWQLWEKRDKWLQALIDGDVAAL